MGCGKAPEMDNYSYAPIVSPLNDKSNSDILTLKYNNRIDFKCEVRVQKGEVIDLGEKPIDQIIWQSSDDLSLFRLLSYKVGSKETKIIIKTEKPLEIIYLDPYVDENQHEFFLEYSPAAKISFTRASTTILRDGSVHEKQSFSERTLYENIESRLITETSSFKNEEPVTEDIRCMLMTKINPGYEYQWKRIK
jgi:hypothetical protein